MQKFSTQYQFDSETQASWETDLESLQALQTAPSADVDYFWPVTPSDFQSWMDGRTYTGPEPLRPRPKERKRAEPLPHVTAAQSDTIHELLHIDRQLQDMEYFHRALRLCGGLKEYAMNRHLGYDNPSIGNLVIVRTAGDRETSDSLYSPEEMPDLLGDWEANYVVGYVSAAHVPEDLVDEEDPQLLVKVCQPWVVDSETGQPSKPVWAARRDAGEEGFKTAWADVHSLPWLPVTELPENTLETFYSPDDHQTNYTAVMKETKFGYPVANIRAIRAFANQGISGDTLVQLVPRNLCEYTLQVPTDEKAQGTLLPPDCMRRLELMDKKRELLRRLGVSRKQWDVLNPRNHLKKKKNGKNEDSDSEDDD